MTDPIYTLEVRAKGCLAEFFLNDVPLVRRGEGDGRELGANAAFPVNQYLHAGANEVTIVVHPGPTPGTAAGLGGVRAQRITLPEPEVQGEAGEAHSNPDPEVCARATLARTPRGGVAGGHDTETLLKVSYEGRDDGRPEPFPRVHSGAVELEGLPAEWPWEQAQRHVAVDDAMRQEIRALLTTLHASLGAGDVEPFIELSRPRLEDIAGAYGASPLDKVEELRQMAAADAAQPDFALEPLAPELDLRICGEGRLVEVLTPQWRAPLREVPRAEGAGSYVMLVAKVDGSWRIVR
jgi:hypothetical protein